jgi:hypothetical protein
MPGFMERRTLQEPVLLETADALGKLQKSGNRKACDSGLLGTRKNTNDRIHPLGVGAIE